MPTDAVKTASPRAFKADNAYTLTNRGVFFGVLGLPKASKLIIAIKSGNLAID